MTNDLRGRLLPLRLVLPDMPTGAPTSAPLLNRSADSSASAAPQAKTTLQAVPMLPAAALPTTITVMTVPAAPATTHGWGEWSEANSTLAAGYASAGGAAVVGIVTLFGVWLSLRNSRKESTRERQHAADQAHIARLTTARREIYMEAIEEFVKGMLFLGTLAQRDIGKFNPFMGLQGLSVASSRIAVVAEQELALKARDINGRLAVFVLQAMKFLLPLNAARQQAETFESLRLDASAQAKRVLGLMGHHLEQHENNQDRWDALQKSFDMHSSNTTMHQSRRDRSTFEQNGYEMEYAEFMRAEIMPLMLAIDDIVCDMRAELGIATDRAVFRNQAEDFQIQQIDAYRKVMALWQVMRDQQTENLKQAKDNQHAKL